VDNSLTSLSACSEAEGMAFSPADIDSMLSSSVGVDMFWYDTPTEMVECFVFQIAPACFHIE